MEIGDVPDFWSILCDSSVIQIVEHRRINRAAGVSKRMYESQQLVSFKYPLADARGSVCPFFILHAQPAV
jgi:hypothetical protein